MVYKFCSTKGVCVDRGGTVYHSRTVNKCIVFIFKINKPNLCTWILNLIVQHTTNLMERLGQIIVAEFLVLWHQRVTEREIIM